MTPRGQNGRLLNYGLMRPPLAEHAHNELVVAAAKLQADALDIETRAKARLAAEYLEAQKRGEVASGGERNDLLPLGKKVATVADLGLTHKQIFEG